MADSDGKSWGKREGRFRGEKMKGNSRSNKTEKRWESLVSDVPPGTIRRK